MSHYNLPPVKLTKAGLTELKQELAELVEGKRPQAINRVARARDFGDLTENSEYQVAREELALIEGRIEELQELVKRAVVIRENQHRQTVDLGCTVTVVTNGQAHQFNIVGEWEADPANQKISAQSPLGKALVGKRVGETVEFEAPAGKVVYTIKKIH